MSETVGRYSDREQGQMKGNGADSNLSRLNNTSRDGAGTRVRGDGMSNSAGEIASLGVEKTEEAIAAVGERISHFGDTIRETMPDTGTVGTAAVAIADGLKSSGEYLKTHGFEEMSSDVTEVIRRHPVPAVWIGLGVGFILGQALVRK